ncbi:MAG: hypothetical protein WC755_01370 [Candidatus Woesearchaeota archaeon]
MSFLWKSKEEKAKESVFALKEYQKKLENIAKSKELCQQLINDANNTYKPKIIDASTKILKKCSIAEIRPDNLKDTYLRMYHVLRIFTQNYQYISNILQINNVLDNKISALDAKEYHDLLLTTFIAISDDLFSKASEDINEESKKIFLEEIKKIKNKNKKIYEDIGSDSFIISLNTTYNIIFSVLQKKLYELDNNTKTITGNNIVEMRKITNRIENTINERVVLNKKLLNIYDFVSDNRSRITKITDKQYEIVVNIAGNDKVMAGIMTYLMFCPIIDMVMGPFFSFQSGTVYTTESTLRLLIVWHNGHMSQYTGVTIPEEVATIIAHGGGGLKFANALVKDSLSNIMPLAAALKTT